jgi:hypothetical protein
MKNDRNHQVDRRRFLAASSAGAIGAWLATGRTSGDAKSGTLLAAQATDSSTELPKIAFLGTEVRQHSHAQHFLDRHTLGYSWRGGW